MNFKILVLFSYLMLTLVIGFIFLKVSKRNSVEFFLAGRKLKNVLLFFTLAATNFSAFTIFGFSGAGYRIGYAFYPVMGFGTGFMALSFFIIGEKIMTLSKTRNYITPSDFIMDRYNSPFLKYLFSSIMIVFTLPYIAIQAISAGKSLNAFTGLPYFEGAVLITAFVVIYVSNGGLRSIVWTDLIQGLMMISFTAIAFSIVIHKSGGIIKVHESINNNFPELMGRPGSGNVMKPGIWLGYMLLWLFANPMFPQLFQRFIAADSKKDLRTAMILYPIITTSLFFITVSIGVIGRYCFGELPKNLSDSIFSLLLSKYTTPIIGSVLFTGSIAALMSTMDSQLLTLTSMISLDFTKIKQNEVPKEKIILITLGIIGLLISYKPPTTILNFISKTTFNGLSVLSPTVIAGLYWKKANKYGAIASILIGEIMVTLYYLGIIKTPNIHPFIIILLLTASLLFLVSYFTRSKNENKSIVFEVNRKVLPWAIVFIIIFILANDFWNWGKEPVIYFGLPGWIWYYFLLGGLLSMLYLLFSRWIKT
ncbi:MAG: sodium:solute symporter family protein [Spirochaetes bacterium]|nr:MAG: sodium:solute symporter family protein [Spirochaetota bacterium]